MQTECDELAKGQETAEILDLRLLTAETMLNSWQIGFPKQMIRPSVKSFLYW